VAITAARSGLSEESARPIVEIVRELRRQCGSPHHPTLRACVMVARLTRLKDLRPDPADAEFAQVCQDVLNVDGVKITREGKPLFAEKIEECVQRVAKAARGNGRK
jgi:hypothetical protein